MEEITIKDGVEVSKTVGTEQQSSIEITQNAKGERAFKVKVYCDSPKEMEEKLDAYLVIGNKKLMAL